jgi:hypothetical protein
MKTYKVAIIETSRMEVEVEAPSRYEAERLVEKQWKDSEYILDSSNFEGVKFTAAAPRRERGTER